MGYFRHRAADDSQVAHIDYDGQRHQIGEY